MKNKLSAVILILIIISAVSCKAPYKKSVPVQDEFNRSHYGKAVIKEIAEARESTGGSSIGYVVIYFDFIPADPEEKGKYLCSTCPDKKIKLFYDNRDTFHLNWVKKWNIRPGSEYPAIRHEMIRTDKTSAVSHEVFIDPAK